MAVRSANALWEGGLKDGKGTMKFGAFEGPFTFVSRFESGEGTNPEELVGAAHAGCFSMFLSALVDGENLKATSIKTEAKVTLGEEGGGPKITSIELTTEADIPGIAEDKFNELVATAKEKCPISRLYAGTDISVNASVTQILRHFQYAKRHHA